MWAEVHIQNTIGYTCYGCTTTVSGVDLFHFPDLAHPNGWLCSNCLVAKLKDGTLVLRLKAEDDTVVCTNCDDPIDTASETTYCGSCYDNNAGDGMNHCDSCDDDGSVYCLDCAKEQWDLTNESPECNQCSDVAEFLYCETHQIEHDEELRGEASGPVDARAADGIEVDWDD